MTHRQAAAVAYRERLRTEAAALLRSVDPAALTLTELRDLIALLRPAAERMRS